MNGDLGGLRDLPPNETFSKAHAVLLINLVAVGFLVTVGLPTNGSVAKRYSYFCNYYIHTNRWSGNQRQQNKISFAYETALQAWAFEKVLRILN